jgi:hypothetical protein
MTAKNLTADDLAVRTREAIGRARSPDVSTTMSRTRQGCRFPQDGHGEEFQFLPERRKKLVDLTCPLEGTSLHMLMPWRLKQIGVLIENLRRCFERRRHDRRLRGRGCIYYR